MGTRVNVHGVVLGERVCVLGQSYHVRRLAEITKFLLLLTLASINLSAVGRGHNIIGPCRQIYILDGETCGRYQDALGTVRICYFLRYSLIIASMLCALASWHEAKTASRV